MALNPKDYARIAQLHIDSLDQSFLGQLGPAFISEMYRALDHSASTVLLIERRGGEIAGFVSGGTSMGPVYKKMLTRLWRWGPALVLRLLSVKRIKRVMDILKYSGSSQEGSLPAHELLSIAVDKEARGKGVAADLYQALITHFKAQDVRTFKILVGEQLAPAHRFYTKMGAQKRGEIELHPGETSVLYVHDVEV